jgi:hypothetical protein
MSSSADVLARDALAGTERKRAFPPQQHAQQDVALHHQHRLANLLLAERAAGDQHLADPGAGLSSPASRRSAR